MSQPVMPGAWHLRGWQAADADLLSAWCNQAGVAPDLSGDAAQWLILADAASGAPLACLRLVEHLGHELPRFSYHVGRVVHAAAELALFRTQTTLLLGNDHCGESELADLACAPGLPAQVQTAYLTQLIQAALVRIQAQPARFGECLMVELAGPRDDRGQAPFWQGLGAHFYAGSPLAAQTKFGDAWRSHLAALLPRQTLYLSFLSAAAQAALGQVGAAAQSAAQALAACGFVYSRHVRVDDGGPIWELRLAPQADISC
ncbi:arginine N-succinyltransferase [Paucibacter sp. B2R-40]|uniref:arginine N-succinyltransferase n=1 Tax=Paucibacter sp. B2R-40 TaxID=2893554 RepID=UPI0021E402E1|nr:arginine N-succinyltransferase [Paucibacter sp. B2R-40]MCV2353944.1 arginine N-succinyltransferase [Paucibacter sp. B2R-40]